MTSLARTGDVIDLFVAGFDGGVYSTAWTAPGGWFDGRLRLGDNRFADNFTVPPGTPIAAISRFAEHLDLFASGRDGHVYSTFWDASTGWSGQWFWLGDVNFGDQFTVPPGSPVTAVSRFRDQIDLFVSGRDGAIYSTFWNAASGWHDHWFRLGDDHFWDNFTVVAGSPVTAISRFADHLDLFVTGRDGGIYSTFWDGSSGWSNRWFRLGDARLGTASPFHRERASPRKHATRTSSTCSSPAATTVFIRRSGPPRAVGLASGLASSGPVPEVMRTSRPARPYVAPAVSHGPARRAP